VWDQDNHYSKVVIVFLIKSLHRLTSIQLLCKKGLAKDAVPLLRAMFEELVDLNYMSMNREKVDDFVEYDTYERYKMGRALIRSDSENIDRGRVTARNAELSSQWEAIKHRFTYTVNGRECVFRRWTKQNVRELSEQVGLGSMYDYLFAHLSIYVHSSPISADDYVLGRSGDSVVLSVGASPKLVAEVAATSSAIYLDMLRIANMDFNMGIEDLITSVEATLGEARKIRQTSRIPKI
jgi:hypothetical protein